MTFNLISRSSFGTLCWQECKGESLEVEIERQTVKGGRPPSTQQWPGARNCVHHVRKWRRFEEDLIGGCRRGRRVHGDHGAARRGGGGSILARHRTSEGVDGANRYCATPILVIVIVICGTAAWRSRNCAIRGLSTPFIFPAPPLHRAPALLPPPPALSPFTPLRPRFPSSIRKAG